MSARHAPVSRAATAIRRLRASALGVVLASCAVCAVLPQLAQAGQNCEAKPMRAMQMADAIELAARTSRWLDASGAQVVLIARRGQNLDEWNLRYSHLGWAYKDVNSKAWRVVHKLNQCGTAEGSVYRQGLGEFFLDDLYALEAGIEIPKPDVQSALLAVLQDSTRATVMHHKPYNMVAYPWARRYQQSNQWALETLAMAVEPGATTRERAQSWLQFKGYQPTVLRINPMKRLGARVGTAHIAFDDHPNAERYADRIATVTVDSIFSFMQTAGLGAAPEVVR
ncbi:MAG: hypothetical protein RIQ60_2959 [Pseudomonadota bacterium]|jgi:hypothetical protein